MFKKKPSVYIIYCHPSENSITNTIKEGYIKGLKEKRIHYTINDLYKSNFNSEISEKEYLRENYNMPFPLEEYVQTEQKNINNSDILTFIFPLFWMDAPSKLVGYFSRVFTKGFKYENEDNISLMKTMKQTNFLISAGSSYNDLERDGKISSLKTIFEMDRMNGKSEKTKMYFFDQTTHDKEKILNNRQKYFDRAKEIGRNTI